MMILALTIYGISRQKTASIQRLRDAKLRYAPELLKDDTLPEEFVDAFIAQRRRNDYIANVLSELLGDEAAPTLPTKYYDQIKGFLDNQ